MSFNLMMGDLECEKADQNKDKAIIEFHAVEVRDMTNTEK